MKREYKTSVEIRVKWAKRVERYIPSMMSMERVRSFLTRVANVGFPGGNPVQVETLCVKLSDRAPAETKKVCFLKEKTMVYLAGKKNKN